MSSILTNSSAMTALQTLKSVNKGLNETQARVSTGLAISSGKDNAAYFAISETMKGDSNMFKAINEGLTAKTNSVSTARLGAETVKDLASEFTERVAFAQNANDAESLASIQSELTDLVSQIGNTINNATFNGESLVDSTDAVTVVTGIDRSGATLATTDFTFNEVDLGAIQTALAAIDVSTSTDLAADLVAAEGQLAAAVTAATSLGTTEKTLEGQQSFLGALTDTLDSGVSSMVDANMEEEAARLQALQVQQQLATQSLAIANQAPQNILSLFR